MATAALLTSAPSRLYFPRSAAAAFSSADTPNMYLTRPKSAKGRRRPSFSCSQSLEACPCQVPPLPPPPHPLVSSQRGSSTKPASGQVSPVAIPELLQQVPSRISSSLNKYRVLPSIGCRSAGSGAVEAVAEQTDPLKVSQGREDDPKIKALSGEQGSASVLSGTAVPDEGSSCTQHPPEKPGRRMREENPSMSALSVEESLREESHLLLAIRSPSGQRFEQRFKPTDSLQTVLAAAEQKMSAQYQCCSLETMEVPRRSFSDLGRSLRECGLLHKSVLCIRREEQQDAGLEAHRAAAVGSSKNHV